MPRSKRSPPGAHRRRGSTDAVQSSVLTEIRSHRRGSKRRALLLDGEPWRSIPVEVLKELGLRPGDTVEAGLLDVTIAALEPRFARERCLRLLAVRERTRSELMSRLLEDGYDTEVAEATVGRLVDAGLVDDARFAEAMARSLVTIRRLGRARAFRELTRRGLSDELAEQALDTVAPRADERERTLDAARRLLKASDTVPRLASRLVRRGFTASDAFEAARSIMPDSSGDDGFDAL